MIGIDTSAQIPHENLLRYLTGPALQCISPHKKVKGTKCTCYASQHNKITL